MKIFIIHGWAYNTNRWVKIISLLKKTGFEPVQLTIPGLTEKSDKVFNLDDYVKWLYQKLKNERDVILLCHSNGGRIALNYVIENPDKIKRLFLIGSAGIYHDELPIRLKRYLFGLSAKIGKKLIRSEFLKNLLYKLAGTSDYKDAAENMKKTMLNLINSDKKLNLLKVAVPTILIWGDDDSITPLSDAKKMNSLIKKSKLEIIPGGKHSPHFTHPQQVVEIIVEEVK